MSAQENDQTPDRPRKRVCLGMIATAHGVKGLVKVLCYGDNPLLMNGALYGDETGPGTLAVTMKNAMGKYWLAEIGGVADRDAALALRGIKLWCDRDALPDADPADGEFYIEDLIGLAAIDEAGAPAGKIIAVENFGAGDLLEIAPPQGQSYYLLFTDHNVPHIDVEHGRITICRPRDV